MVMAPSLQNERPPEAVVVYLVGSFGRTDELKGELPPGCVLLIHHVRSALYRVTIQVEGSVLFPLLGRFIIVEHVVLYGTPSLL